MKTIRFGEKEDRKIINIEDVKENVNKIYCYKDNSDFKFLHHCHETDQYIWIDLFLDLKGSGRATYGGHNGYRSFDKAFTFLGEANCKVLIFDSQCDVLEYAKKL